MRSGLTRSSHSGRGALPRDGSRLHQAKPQVGGAGARRSGPQVGEATRSEIAAQAARSRIFAASAQAPPRPERDERVRPQQNTAFY